VDITNITTPGIYSNNVLFLFDIKSYEFLDSDRIQVHITAQFQEITVFFYKDCLVPTLIKVTASIVTTIVINCVGGVESLHKTAEICLGGH